MTSKEERYDGESKIAYGSVKSSAITDLNFQTQSCSNYANENLLSMNSVQINN